MSHSDPSRTDRSGADDALAWVLGIDAATPPSSVALAHGARVVGWRTGPFGPKTDAWVLGAIEELLEEAGIGLPRLNAIAAGVGPGTFTGIRVAIGTAQGLARGAGVPVTGVSTLAAMARGADAAEGAEVMPLIDARRQQLYAARFMIHGGALTTIQEPHVTTADRVVASHVDRGSPLLLGTGIATDARLEELAQAALRPWPVAGSVALLAADRMDRGDGASLPPPLPVYLRAPDARVGANPLERG